MKYTKSMEVFGGEVISEQCFIMVCLPTFGSPTTAIFNFSRSSVSTSFDYLFPPTTIFDFSESPASTDFDYFPLIL